MRLKPETVFAILKFVAKNTNFSVKGMLREPGSIAKTDDFFDSIYSHLSNVSTKDDLSLKQFDFPNQLNVIALPCAITGFQLPPNDVSLTLGNIATRAFTEMDLSSSKKLRKQILDAAKTEVKKIPEKQDLKKLIALINKLTVQDHDFWAAYEKLIFIGRLSERNSPIKLAPNCISKLLGSCLLNALSEKGKLAKPKYLKSLYVLFDSVVKETQFSSPTVCFAELPLSNDLPDLSSLEPTTSDTSISRSITPTELETAFTSTVPSSKADEVFHYLPPRTPAFHLSTMKLDLDIISSSLDIENSEYAPPTFDRFKG